MAQIIAKGIDVSQHNGTINWTKVKNAGIQFVMIRAGYGISAVDPNFIKNITGAKYAGLNIGVYWFSYAQNAQRARDEANFFIKTIEPYRDAINMPVCFDWEYDSENYIRKTYGIHATKSLVSEMANAFLLEVEKAGYYAMNYTNIDYIRRFFSDQVLKRFDIWVACWSSNAPSVGYPYGIWQYGAEENHIDSKYVDGISGVVDKNYMYKDYPAYYKSKHEGNAVPDNLSNPTQINPAPTTESKTENDSPKTSTSFKAGDEVTLSNTMLYASAGTTVGIKKSGTYFIYSNEVVNGKIRITNSRINVGKTPIGSYVTGFVKVADLINIESVHPPATVKNNSGYTKGTKVVLTNVTLYASSTTNKSNRKVSGTYWIYDGINISGRLRITNSQSNVGRTPIGSYVTGFIKISDIK